MKPCRDEDLIAFLFGDAEEPEAVAAALAESPELRMRLESLRATLDLVGREDIVPDLDGHFGARMWAGIEKRLAEEPGLGTVVDAAERFAPAPAPSRWIGWTAAALLLVGVGFVIGRLGPGPATGDPTVAAELSFSDQGRERLLQAALSDHFVLSEWLLTEVTNASDGARPDAALEQQWAAELLSANRLYRRSAEQAGQVRIAKVLAELEPVLIELAHSAHDAGGEEWRDLQRRIDDRGLLFKVRVTGGRLANPSSTGDI